MYHYSRPLLDDRKVWITLIKKNELNIEPFAGHIRVGSHGDSNGADNVRIKNDLEKYEIFRIHLY